MISGDVQLAADRANLSRISAGGAIVRRARSPRLTQLVKRKPSQLEPYRATNKKKEASSGFELALPTRPTAGLTVHPNCVIVTGAVGSIVPDASSANRQSVGWNPSVQLGDGDLGAVTRCLGNANLNELVCPRLSTGPIQAARQFAPILLQPVDKIQVALSKLLDTI
jgi:hypothetical protein